MNREIGLQEAPIPPSPVKRGRVRVGATPTLIAGVLGLASLALYLRTLAPSVATIFDDSLEFQLVGPTLGIAHPTGYPLYTLLAWLFSRLPVGDAAYRVNLLSAVSAAVAVGVVYLAAYEWVEGRLAAVIGSVAFALSPVFWSQATIAEVYALHAFFVALVLWVTLRAGKSEPAPSHFSEPPSSAQEGRGGWKPLAGFTQSPQKDNVARWLLPAACLGLSLTHHRMTLLLIPAVVIFALWTTPLLLWQPRRWPRLIIAFLAPLLLYLYIPLRGLTTTSLDGTYRNTWDGFWRWITAGGYSIFLSGNPFGVRYDARFYFNLFQAQFGWVGLALGALGLIAMLREPRRWVLVALAFAANLAFGLAYRAADVEVFFIPAFLIWAIFMAAGFAVLLAALRRVVSLSLYPIPLLSSVRGEEETKREKGSSVDHLRLPIAGSVLLAALSLVQPILMAQANWPRLDRSAAWDVHDYGVDALSQLPPHGATVVGILGEMTLLRYFQQTARLQPDVKTVAADAEDARHAAILRALEAGGAVYITRPLVGAPERYSLSVAGPLVRVWPKGGALLPLPPRPLNFDFLDGKVRWAGYDLAWRKTHRGTVARVMLWWEVRSAPGADYKVSARLLDGNGNMISQVDDAPVHNTYPPHGWQAGETVLDGYDLPLPRGAGPAPYRLLVILYDPATGAEVSRAEVPIK